MQESYCSFSVTLKNYRCFEDTDPLVINFEEGITSFIGSNNSGKSSALRFFYEFRNFWEQLDTTQQWVRLINSNSFHVSIFDVTDQHEIYCDNNERPLSIELTLLPNIENSLDGQLSKFILTSDRNTWTMKVFEGPQYRQINTKVNHGNREILLPVSNTEQQILDSTSMRTLCKYLQTCMYIGPFRNAINQGAGIHYDLAIGTEFINKWNNWKAGTEKSKNLVISQVTSDIKEIFNFDYLEIGASAGSNSLQLNVNGKPYKLQEMGAGLAQFIIVLGNVATAKPNLLFIDEPELSLHPSLQLRFLTALASYVRKSIVFATHSIGLARTASDKIYSFAKLENKSRAWQFAETPEYSEFLGELSYSTYRDFGFQTILFVEGPNDIKTFQEFLRKLRKDQEIVVLNLGGDSLASGSREHELAEIKRISNDIYVIVDSEKPSENEELPEVRSSFKNLCEKLGFHILVLEKRAIENYFSDRAIKKVFGQEYEALQPFQKLKDAKLPWRKNQNWRIAREMRVDELIDTDLGEFISKMGA